MELTNIEKRVGSTSDANTVYSDISLSDRVSGSDASPGSEPFYMSIDEAVETRIKSKLILEFFVIKIFFAVYFGNAYSLDYW